MNVDMNDIDDILQDLNIGTSQENTNSSTQNSTPTEETDIPLSDEELDEIIEDH